MIRGIGASVAVAVAAIAYFSLTRKGLHFTNGALVVLVLVNWVNLVNEIVSFVYSGAELVVGDTALLYFCRF